MLIKLMKHVEDMTHLPEEIKATNDTLHSIATNVMTRDLSTFEPQEISNALWSFTTVGFGVATKSSNDDIDNDEKNSLTCEHHALVKSALMIVVENEMHPLNDFTPQELNNLAWAYARLTTNNHNNSDAATTSNGNNDGNHNNFHFAHHNIANEVGNRCTCVSSQDISTTLWSFASLGYNIANPKSLSPFDQTQQDDDDVNTCRKMLMLAASRIALKYAPLFKPQG